MTEIAIESILQENRLFPPSAEFAQNATIKSFEEYQQLYAKAKADPQAFWGQQRFLTGSPPLLNGSSTARLIFVTTVLTDISPPGDVIKPPSSGKENRETAAPLPTNSYTEKCVNLPTL